MQTASLMYGPETGWSQSLPAELDSPSTLILVFAAPSLTDQTLTFWRDLLEHFPQAHKIGCTSSVPVFQTGLAQDQAVVAIVRFEQATLKTAHSADLGQGDSLAVGRSVAEQLVQGGDDLRFVFVVGDDRIDGIARLVEGMNQVFPPAVTVTGGLTGHVDYLGGDRAVFVGDQHYEHVVAAVGIYGSGLVVKRHWQVGFEDSSPVYEVTRAEGKFLYELGGEPALTVYERFLGDLAQHLGSSMIHTIFPVGFYDQPDGERKFVRSVVAIDRDREALHFAGEIPAARYARMMTGLSGHLVRAAGSVAQAAFAPRSGQLSGESGLSIMVSCVSRFSTLMDNEKAAEVEAVAAALPGSEHLVGFYAGGEIGHIASSVCGLLNHTVNMIYLDEQ